MDTDTLDDAMDLTREDLDPERFAAALAVQHIRRLLMYGGSQYRWRSDEDDLQPAHFERFLPRALEQAQRTRHFVDHWKHLLQILPYVRTAWVKGATLFQEDLTRAADSPEQMDYFSLIDFAVDCYAYISARNTYPDDQMLQEWAANGYMRAWRRHFLDEEEHD